MRKLVFAIAGLVVLCGAFVLLWFRNQITDGIFIAWIGGVMGIVGIYAGANVQSKKWWVEGRKVENGKNPTMGITG